MGRAEERWHILADGTTPVLAVVAVSFFLGGLAGCLLASRISGSGADSLGAYMDSFLRAASNGELAIPDAAALIWDTVRWPLLTLLLGFTALGLVGLPLLFAARGFLLAFAIAALVRLFGGAGCLLALTLFGISGAVSVPVLFVLGVQSFQASRVLAGRVWGDGKGRTPYGKTYFLRCGVCAGALCVCVILDGFVVPALLSGLAGLL